MKKPFQQGRSERRPESYAVRYVEGLSDARTMLEGFCIIVYVRGCIDRLKGRF